nr:conserved hypothetical protein [Hymenolepis microstoma]
MNRRGVNGTPPALPPKLFKIRRSESQTNNTYRSPLSLKNTQNGHQNSRSCAQSKQPSGLDNVLSSILSLTSTDLKGKPRDELVLMLLHLNHEKANLLRWKEYFNEQIMNLASAAETDPKASEEIDSLCLALKDVESQLKACLPITTFLNKKLRMNDVCAGDNSMSGSPAYERTNLSLTRQKSINFLRREEEREVARALKVKLSQNSMELAETYGVVTASRMLEGRKRQSSVESTRVIKLKDYPEEPAFRERRLQLESELRKLDELWKEACEYAPLMSPPTSKTVSTSCRRQKSSVLRRLESRKLDFYEATRPLSACDATNLAYVPRRSTRRLYRSDLSSSFSADLERRPVRSQSQSSLRHNREVVESSQLRAVNRSLSSASIGGPSVRQKQRHSSENPRICTVPKQKSQAASGYSSFLMQPTQAVQSRWKVSTDEEDVSSSNSAFSSHPPLLPPPPVPGQRKSSSFVKSPSQLNRWRSFGDNLAQLDPQLKPRIDGSKCSERSRNSHRQIKSITSDSNQPTFLERTDDVLPIPSEDFYEKEPYVESLYLTPRDLNSSSTGANGQTFEEQPLSASFLTTAVEYIPSETNYDTTEGNSVTTYTYPPDLTKEPANKRVLALPKPVYPLFDQQNDNEKKPLTLPISMFSAFRIPEKSVGLHQTQSAI